MAPSLDCTHNWVAIARRIAPASTLFAAFSALAAAAAAAAPMSAAELA